MKSRHIQLNKLMITGGNRNLIIFLQMVSNACYTNFKINHQNLNNLNKRMKLILRPLTWHQKTLPSKFKFLSYRVLIVCRRDGWNNRYSSASMVDVLNNWNWVNIRILGRWLNVWFWFLFQCLCHWFLLQIWISNAIGN